MQIGARTGSSDSRDSFLAGREAAREACDASHPPALVIVFGTAGHDQRALVDGVRSVTKDSPLVGCSAEGVIDQAGSRETSHTARVMCIHGDLRATPVLARDAGADPAAAARTLADALRGRTPKVVLLFPDGLTINTAALLRALHEAMPGTRFVGGAAGDMMQFDRTWQYANDAVITGGVAAVALEGPFHVGIAVTHGCDPLGIEHVVTRAEGAYVQTLDDQPAWTVMQSYLDEPATDLTAASVPFLCLATRGPGDDADLIMRVPLGLDAETGALFFPGELKTGETVMMARRSTDLITERAVRAAAGLATGPDGQRPAFMMQFDCTGRGRILYGDRATSELITPIQEACGRDIPWLGFHCYGEIAPIGGVPCYHNYTMALCAFYPEDVGHD